MPRNIELKARLASLEAARVVAARIATQQLGRMRQVDTYFACARGRLKLREIESDGSTSAELIWYERPDRAGPKTSDYRRAQVADPAELKVALTSALGLRTVVDKRREVYLWDNVRIHLDQVERLGTFLEFEAVVNRRDEQEAADGQLSWLREQFSLAEADLVTGSYADLVVGRLSRAVK